MAMGRRDLKLIAIGAGPSVGLIGLMFVALLLPEFRHFARYLAASALVSAIAFPALANVLRMRRA